MTNTISKICRKCNLLKGFDDLVKNKARDGGVESRCKSCRSAKRRLTWDAEVYQRSRARFKVAHPLYTAWLAMKARCDKPLCPNYPLYGGRGVSICKRWRVYRNFETDMLPTHKAELSLDRIDNNGNYEPSNCKWSTPLEQANNTRKVRKFTFEGKTLSISAWARSLGASRRTISKRFALYGQPIEGTLTLNSLFQ